MKILVTGAAGMLGSKVVSTLNPDHHVLLVDRAFPPGETRCDITSAPEVNACFQSHRPDAVIHCAAFTAVDQCESESHLAYQVNETGTRNIALAAEAVNAAVFYVSTDYVFDGNKSSPYIESDPTHPLSVYGSSKLRGEETLKEHCSQWTIGRTQWLYGEGGGNFVETMIRLSKERDQIKVVEDQWGSPTYTGDLASQIKVLVEGNKRGVYHVSNQGSTSWFTFASAILNRTSLPSVEVLPCTTEDYPLPATRPRNSTLLNHRLNQEGLNVMRDWDVALEDYLTHRLSKRG